MIYQTKKGESVGVSFNFAAELGVQNIDEYTINASPTIDIIHDKTSKAVRAVIKPGLVGAYSVTCELVGKGIKNSIQVEVSD